MEVAILSVLLLCGQGTWRQKDDRLLADPSLATFMTPLPRPQINRSFPRTRFPGTLAKRIAAQTGRSEDFKILKKEDLESLDKNQLIDLVIAQEQRQRKGSLVGLTDTTTMLDVQNCARIIQMHRNEYQTSAIQKHVESSAPPISSLVQTPHAHAHVELVIQKENDNFLGGVEYFNRNEHPDYHRWHDEIYPKDRETQKGEKVIALEKQKVARKMVTKPIFDKIANANNGVVVVSIVNWGQLHLLANFGKSAEKRGIDWKKKLFVYTMDSKSQSWLEREGVPSYHFPNTDSEQAAVVYGDEQFRLVAFFKSAAMEDGLSHGHDILYQDVDTVWRQDPTSFFLDDKRIGVDVFFSYDGGNTQWQPLYANSGFHFTRNNQRTRRFWRECYLNADRFQTQQQTVEPLLVHHYFLYGLKVHILSDQFANGHLFNGKWSMVPSAWKTAHASWTVNATDKVGKFTTLGEWHLPSGCKSLKACELT